MSAATSRFAAIAAFAAAVAVVGALGFFVVLPGAGGALAWEPSYKEAGTELRMVPLGRNASVVAAALQVPFARGVRDGAAPWTLQPAVVPASEPLFVFAPDMEYWDTYLQQEFITLFRNLRGAFRWRQLSVLPGSWGELSAALVAAYGRLPDVLLFSVGFQDDRWAAVARLGPPPAGLTTWIYFDDIHVHAHTGQTNRDNHLAAMTHASLVVTPYAYHLGRAFWPELARKPRLWLPHAAAPIFMVPANAEPQVRKRRASGTAAECVLRGGRPRPRAQRGIEAVAGPAPRLAPMDSAPHAPSRYVRLCDSTHRPHRASRSPSFCSPAPWTSGTRCGRRSRRALPRATSASRR